MSQPLGRVAATGKSAGGWPWHQRAARVAAGTRLSHGSQQGWGSVSSVSGQIKGEGCSDRGSGSLGSGSGQAGWEAPRSPGFTGGNTEAQAVSAVGSSLHGLQSQVSLPLGYSFSTTSESTRNSGAQLRGALLGMDRRPSELQPPASPYARS